MSGGWRIEAVTTPEPCYVYKVSDAVGRVHSFRIRRRWYENAERFNRRVQRRIDWSLSR